MPAEYFQTADVSAQSVATTARLVLSQNKLIHTATAYMHKYVLHATDATSALFGTI